MRRMRVRRRGGARGEDLHRTWRESAGENAGRACGGRGVPGRGAVCAGGAWSARGRCDQRRDKRGMRRGEVAQHTRERLSLSTPTI